MLVERSIRWRESRLLVVRPPIQGRSGLGASPRTALVVRIAQECHTTQELDAKTANTLFSELPGAAQLAIHCPKIPLICPHH